MEVMRKVGRAVWMEVDLDAMTHNVKLLKQLSENPSAGNCMPDSNFCDLNL